MDYLKLYNCRYFILIKKLCTFKINSVISINTIAYRNFLKTKTNVGHLWFSEHIFRQNLTILRRLCTNESYIFIRVPRREDPHFYDFTSFIQNRNLRYLQTACNISNVKFYGCWKLRKIKQKNFLTCYVRKIVLHLF